MITITNIVVEDVEDVNEFIYEVMEGLNFHKKHSPDFGFRVDVIDDKVEIKTIKLNECAN